jgi:uncharacterized protein
MDEGGPGPGYALQRLLRMAVPRLTVTAPPAGLVFERDVAVQLRDGVTLRANVFRPQRDGRFPVLLSAHPYGKDDLPRRTLLGYQPPTRYRVMRQPEPVTFSAYTGWEAPDPGFWVPRGYAVVNLDLRGFGTSEGTGALFSDQEAADYAEAIEWAAGQPWASGRVGLCGVSYLAISQWKVAALRPPHLAAICPWEGFSDPYRDLAYPGGVREDGFVPFWSSMTERAGRVTSELRREQLAHPERDAFWEGLAPALERIEVPALICASFSDQGLHTRGSFEAFRRIASRQRFLFTHRGGKWSTFYSAQALALQARFFDCFLKGQAGAMDGFGPVRLEVRERADQVVEVRDEPAWPLPSTRWTSLHLAPGALRRDRPGSAATVRFEARTGGARFDLQLDEDWELAGPMKLVLHVELVGASDASLFAAVRKVVGGRHVPFEGPFGFGRDVVTKGWLRVAHRRTTPTPAEPWRADRLHDRAEPLPAGEVARLELELLPSATLFRRGETLRLDVQGHWFWRRNPLLGMFPGAYSPSPEGEVVLHLGGERDAHLLVPRTR